MSVSRIFCVGRSFSQVSALLMGKKLIGITSDSSVTDDLSKEMCVADSLGRQSQCFLTAILQTYCPL